jgi:uncharacterized membrane protein
MSHGANRGALVSAGTMLGIGLGGFFDGIVFHQILQWHQMLSSWVAPTDVIAIKYNMVWDGLFHAFTWIMTVIGIGMSWRAGQRSDDPRATRTFVGSLLLGAGLFNVVEGIIDHHLLGIHHVHPGQDEVAWDIGFLVLGGLLVAGGWALIRARRGGDDAPARAVTASPRG